MDLQTELRRWRGIGERLLALDPDCPHFLEKLNDIKVATKLLEDDRPRGKGSGATHLAYSRKIAITKRQKEAKKRNAELKPIVLDMLDKGLTYIEIGEELIKMGHMPARNDKWSRSTLYQLTLTEV